MAVVNVTIYIIVDPKGDRTYVSTTPPSKERLEAFAKTGVRVYKTQVTVPEARQIPSLASSTEWLV